MPRWPLLSQLLLPLWRPFQQSPLESSSCVRWCSSFSRAVSTARWSSIRNQHIRSLVHRNPVTGGKSRWSSIRNQHIRSLVHWNPGTSADGRKIHPQKNPPEILKSSSEQVFLNNFRWVPDSCHRKRAKSSRELFEKVRVNAAFFGYFGILQSTHQELGVHRNPATSAVCDGNCHRGPQQWRDLADKTVQCSENIAAPPIRGPARWSLETPRIWRAYFAEPHIAVMFSCQTLTRSAKVSCRTLWGAKGPTEPETQKNSK